MSKYRMYSLVLRQLNPIQKGVQAAHSIVEYSAKFYKTTEFIQWSSKDKTIIILDGGTYPELKKCREILDELEVPYSVFYEEDLGNIITSISFIAEDKVWDYKSYPSFNMVDKSSYFMDGDVDDENPLWLADMGGLRNLKLRDFIMSKKLSR